MESIRKDFFEEMDHYEALKEAWNLHLQKEQVQNTAFKKYDISKGMEGARKDFTQCISS